MSDRLNRLIGLITTILTVLNFFFAYKYIYIYINYDRASYVVSVSKSI